MFQLVSPSLLISIAIRCSTRECWRGRQPDYFRHIPFTYSSTVYTHIKYEIQVRRRRVEVVVYGPSGFCHAVSAEVARPVRREKVVFELEVDAFLWLVE